MLRRLSFLVSMQFMAVLLILLIVVLAMGTFIESSYGRETAWAVTYGTHWFEVLLFLIAVNIAGVMIKNKYFRRKKIVIFTFHLAFLLVLAGAAVTRFISYEGTMHIRENEAANTMLSSNAYMQVTLESRGDRISGSKAVRITELTPRDYHWRGKVGGEKVKIRSTGYMADAMEQYVSAPGGIPYLQLVMVTDRQSSVGLPSGSYREVMGVGIAFDHGDTTALLRFDSGEGQLTLFSRRPVTVSQMGEDTTREYQPDEAIPVSEGLLYSAGNIRFALQSYLPSAKRQLVPAPASQKGSHLAAVKVALSYRGMVNEFFVPGLPRLAGQPVTGTMGDLNYSVTYGSREIMVPFSLYLKDFQVERYPGSNSPSSFASEVILIDPGMNIREDRRIFMNNVLKHRGYRFFQSSYDTDELGTILSVNKDWLGTFLTYIGYIVLFGGMLLALFVPGTRFAMIAKKSGSTAKAVILGIILAATGLSARAQEVPPKEMARQFGTLWTQDRGGRYEPINTLSNEVVRKVTKKARYGDYSSDQVLLGMIMYPESWMQKRLFKVTNPELQRITGYRGEMVSFYDLVDTAGHYLLADIVNQAYSKEVNLRTELDKEVIKLDDRLNALYLVRSGALLTIFPEPGEPNHKWSSVSDKLMSGGSDPSDTIVTVFIKFLDALRRGNDQAAAMNLTILSHYQTRQENLLPHESKKNLEMTYNRLNVFPKLLKIYALLGILLLVFQILIVFKPRKGYRLAFNSGVVLLAFFVLVHTVALAVRWYVSGHAPLTNGYESMIFISWLTLVAGLVFVRRSGYTVALTSILATLGLMVAGMSNMNPEITNLVPVLKSTWLTIHVTVIMAGDSFLGLASILGLLNVALYASLTSSNKEKMKQAIVQITRVNHMTMIVGLYFMTTGMFLGGVWANESWGRYWGWDPKETWALITVLVYAFVTHMHRIPGLRGYFAYNLASFFAYSSVMMTYFGVNYFLGGMHSYASGSAFGFPWYTYLFIVLILSLAAFSYLKHRRLMPDAPDQDS